MAIRAQGTTLKFTPKGKTQVTVGMLRSVGEIAPDSEEIDVTTLDSTGGYREYVQGLRDAGEVELTGFHGSDAGQKALREAYASGDAGAVEVGFPDGSKATFNAVVKGYTLGAAEVDGAVGFGAVLRITGGVTIAEAQ